MRARGGGNQVSEAEPASEAVLTSSAPGIRPYERRRGGNGMRCGHGFIGTGARGRGGEYRSYMCFARQRHGTARCDQDRIPAAPVEDAILTVTLDALSDPSFFDEVANLTRREWERTHPGRQKDLQRVARAIDQKRASIERYLTAFESGKLSEGLRPPGLGAPAGDRVPRNP